MNAHAEPTHTAALIVAAGRGRRFGGAQPKQYAGLGGQSVLARTVRAFLTHPRVGKVRCVIHADDNDLYAAALRGVADPDGVLLDPVTGGATRQESVRLGLESLDGLGLDKVLIHDAARPFAAAAVIDGVLDALETHGGAIPAIPVADTLKRGRDGVIAETHPREGLYRAQTPQGFRFAEILQAHRDLQGEELTDDAQLFERAASQVALTAGAEDNFKITTEEDLMRAERLLNGSGAPQTVTRTGFGFDAHRLGPGGPGGHVTLCGVEIPFSQGLQGHSDADVALHALTDALLGAVGAGDIGKHFPPTDRQWKGAASDRFLAHAAAEVRARGGEIVNVDVTIVCEAPKIAPHKDAMRARVADILGIDVNRVSVKATTTEGMGFTGRGEGIAAQAVANVAVG